MLIPTMMLKSAKLTVGTISPPSVSVTKESVFAAVLVEIVTFNALMLVSVDLIQISELLTIKEYSDEDL